MTELIPSHARKEMTERQVGRLDEVVLHMRQEILALDDSKAPPVPILRKGLRLFAAKSQKLEGTGSGPEQLLSPKNADLGATAPPWYWINTPESCNPHLSSVQWSHLSPWRSPMCLKEQQ